MASGPTDDLEKFCTREHSALVGALSLYCGDRYVAEELAQEALIRVCLNWPKVAIMSAPNMWLHRVGINLANSYFRRKAAERRARARCGDNGGPTDLDMANIIAVRQAVSSLPRSQRTIVIMRHFLDLSVEDVAVAVGISPGAVRAMTSRAIKNLRSRLELPESQMGEGASCAG